MSTFSPVALNILSTLILEHNDVQGTVPFCTGMTINGSSFLGHIDGKYFKATS